MRNERFIINREKRENRGLRPLEDLRVRGEDEDEDGGGG